MDEDLKNQLKALNQKVIDGETLNPAQQDLHKQLLCLAQSHQQGKIMINRFHSLFLILFFHLLM